MCEILKRGLRGSHLSPPQLKTLGKVHKETGVRGGSGSSST